jgi:hypothetical protein
MYSDLQRTPGWTDLDIFKITYDEYMAFSIHPLIRSLCS